MFTKLRTFISLYNALTHVLVLNLNREKDTIIIKQSSTMTIATKENTILYYTNWLFPRKSKGHSSCNKEMIKNQNIIKKIHFPQHNTSKVQG